MLTKENVEKLKQTIEDLNSKKEILKSLEEKFNEENKALLDEISNLKTDLENITNEVKEQAIEEFKQTGKKKLLGGIGVRETKYISYDDKTALDWAKSKDMFIMLDKKAFEKTADTLNLDFVKIDKVIQATIPTKEIII